MYVFIIYLQQLSRRLTMAYKLLLPTREEFPSRIEAIASVKALNLEIAED